MKSRLPGLFCLLVLSMGAAQGETTEQQVVHIRTLTAQMKYDLTEIHATPGQPVRIVFENQDDLPHNIVFCQPGTDTTALSMKQLEKPEEALKRNWLPEDPSIWSHSKMLNPHQKDEFGFTAPAKPGAYPYVCTFPGHSLTMRGTLRVAPQGGGLRDLHFKLYLGDWKILPDFTSLKPHREGTLEDNLVQVKLDDYKNQFGVVFTGKLTAPKTGSYRFYLASDDGGRILVDGKPVVENDGIHPATDVKDKAVALTKGEHDFRLEYFQGGGNVEIFAAWKGADFDITPLSKWLHPLWRTGGKKEKKKNETTGMPLVVGNEPLVYRNFIAGAGNRAIAVGYPGGFNIAWSAESMNLSLIWRGAFIDAARHWNSRGGGYQPPLGYDVIQPAGEVTPALAVLANRDAAWPAYQPDQRYDGFRWKGYSLDSERIPTFRYEWNGCLIEDRFVPQGSATTGHGTLARFVRLGNSKARHAGAYFLLLSGDVARGKANSFVLNRKLVVHFMGTPEPVLRDVTGSKQVLIPVGPDASESLYTFSYSWLQ